MLLQLDLLLQLKSAESLTRLKVIGMGKESWFIKLLKRIGLIKTYEVSKEEMCRRAVQSGVCPGDCSRCAWGERSTKS